MRQKSVVLALPLCKAGVCVCVGWVRCQCTVTLWRLMDRSCRDNWIAFLCSAVDRERGGQALSVIHSRVHLVWCGVPPPFPTLHPCHTNAVCVNDYVLFALLHTSISVSAADLASSLFIDDAFHSVSREHNVFSTVRGSRK